MTPSSPSRPDDAGLLRELAASPRPTGGPSIERARQLVARELTTLGFEVRELPFAFSSFPGRLATPLFGGAALVIVGVAGHLGASGSRFAPLLIAALGAVVLGASGAWLARSGVLSMPLLRSRGVNLEARRPHADPPRIWLCAHLDTKSQPVPTLVRAAGIVLTAVGYGGTLALAIASAAGANAHRFYWVAAALVTLAGAIPVVLSMTGSRSSGALDNASGVATVVEAARRLRGRDIGVLITDAEELGLAGARHWSRTNGGPADTIVLNVDGVDDTGTNVVMYSRTRPTTVLDSVSRASAATAIPMRVRRVIPGILTDSVAFTDAGFMSVTFSRGSVASLARVHSRADDLAHLDGTGIAEVADLVTATANELGSWRNL